MAAPVSGMAAAIRGSTESDTFDLAGQNVTTIANTVRAAFADPLPLNDMIRITFVTGAGKLGRQKYDENAAKAVASALRELSFEEDRGASCVKECAGSFKLQHDTGKNLKTVVVFPRILDEAARSTNGGSDGRGVSESPGTAPILDKNSPTEMIALASLKVFQTMIKSRCPSWSQKKGAVTALASVQQMIESYDQKLLKGTPLQDNEQDLYDSVVSLEDKITWLRQQMQQHVEQGQLTAHEKAMLLEQVEEKIKAAKGNNPKLEARKAKLQAIDAPISPPKLKHQDDIVKLHIEMRPLLELEESTKGRLLSVKETQTLARKDEILDEIAQLERRSRGWFEDDDAFDARVQACRDLCESRNRIASGRKKTAAKKPAGATVARPATNAWMSAPVSRSKPRTAAKPKTSRTSNNRGGGVFAAMMMDDSDSDSD